MHPKNLKIFHAETLFVIPVTIPVESMQIHGFICYSPRRDEEERREFAENLALIIESLDKTPIYRWADPADTIRDIAGKYEPFIQWKVEDNRLLLNIKQKSVAKHLRDAGISVYLHAGEDYQWEQCLQWTSEQSEDETFMSVIVRKFQIYPHTIDADVIRQGIFMIAFLSLTMKRWVERQFEEAGLLSVSSMPKIMIELARIRLIGLGNDRTIVTGINTRQKDILDSLKWQVDF
jgi:transposase